MPPVVLGLSAMLGLSAINPAREGLWAHVGPCLTEIPQFLWILHWSHDLSAKIRTGNCFTMESNPLPSLCLSLSCNTWPGAIPVSFRIIQAKALTLFPLGMNPHNKPHSLRFTQIVSLHIYAFLISSQSLLVTNRALYITLHRSSSSLHISTSRRPSLTILYTFILFNLPL